MHQVQPHMVMDNVPVPLKMEQSMIRGEVISEMQQLLIESVLRLQASNIIVIPCNTVHLFIDELRAVSRVPILSIIEETARVCTQKSFRKVGLLASATTVNEKLYESELQKRGIELITPTLEDQQFLSDCIIRILDTRITREDQERMVQIVSHLHDAGAEAVILGCTDFYQIISQKDVDVTVVNSTEVLEQAAIRELLRDIRKGEP